MLQLATAIRGNGRRNRVGWINATDVMEIDQPESEDSALRRIIRLLKTSFPERPAMDLALSKAILSLVSDGASPETLRLYRPGPILAFGPMDKLALGYPRAVMAAMAAGFSPIERLAGGRAAVFHEGTMAFAWTVPDEHPTASIAQRFQDLAEIMCASFRKLGIDARIGQIPGEYCPGAYSVNARGKTKLMGVGQRIAPRAAHVGGVVVVEGRQGIQNALMPVYEALDIRWDPATVGSIEDEVAHVHYPQVEKAILDEFSTKYDIAEGQPTKEELELAQAMEADMRPP